MFPKFSIWWELVMVIILLAFHCIRGKVYCQSDKFVLSCDCNCVRSIRKTLLFYNCSTQTLYMWWCCHFYICGLFQCVNIGQNLAWAHDCGSHFHSLAANMKVSLTYLFETKYDAKNTIVFLDCIPLKTLVQTSMPAAFRGMSDTAEVIHILHMEPHCQWHA